MKLNLGIFHITCPFWGFLKKRGKDDIRITIVLISPLYKNALVTIENVKGKRIINLKFL
jgi:hypothetical protein